MHITALEEYGLRCALALAQAYQTQSKLSAAKIAEMEGISVEYASKIMHLLKKAKLVQAERGTQGGFYLEPAPSAISLKQIFAALCTQSRKKASQNFCHQYSGTRSECVHLQQCSVRPVWNILSVFTDRIFSQVSLEDLLEPEGRVNTLVNGLCIKEVKTMFPSINNTTITRPGEEVEHATPIRNF